VGATAALVAAAAIVDFRADGDAVGEGVGEADGDGVVTMTLGTVAETDWVDPLVRATAVLRAAVEEARFAVSAVPPPTTHKQPTMPTYALRLGFFIGPPGFISSDKRSEARC